MKKLRILFLLFVFALSINSVFADAQYCCEVPDLTCGFNRVVTNALGCNFVAKKVAKRAILKSLRKTTKGDFKVKIDSYSAIDLKNGKIKSLEIEGSNLEADGMYVSAMKMKTICNYNHIDYRKSPMVFKTDVPIYFETILTEEDLNKSLLDVGYFKQLSNLSFYGVTMFTVNDVSFKLKNNKVYLVVSMKVPLIIGEKTIKFTFSAKPNIENGKIVLENVSSDNMRAVNMNKLINKLNSLNPFDIPVRLFEGTDSTLSINNVKILDNKMYINGIIVIKRSCDGQKEKK